MRISDWSSDVCSSDLPRARRDARSRPIACQILLQHCNSSRPSCGSPGHLHREADHRESVIRQLIEPVQFLHLIIAANASCLVALPYDLRVAFRGVAPGRMREGSVPGPRSEEHTSELQSLMRISYAVFCLKKKNTTK